MSAPDLFDPETNPDLARSPAREDADARRNQCRMILAHLESGRGLTQLEATTLYGCVRLPSRIFDLKQAGHRIVAKRVRVPRASGGYVTVAEYRLERAA